MLISSKAYICPGCIGIVAGTLHSKSERAGDARKVRSVWQNHLLQALLSKLET